MNNFSLCSLSSINGADMNSLMIFNSILTSILQCSLLHADERKSFLKDFSDIDIIICEDLKIFRKRKLNLKVT